MNLDICRCTNPYLFYVRPENGPTNTALLEAQHVTALLPVVMLEQLQTHDVDSWDACHCRGRGDSRAPPPAATPAHSLSLFCPLSLNYGYIMILRMPRQPARVPEPCGVLQVSMPG